MNSKTYCGKAAPTKHADYFFPDSRASRMLLTKLRKITCLLACSSCLNTGFVVQGSTEALCANERFVTEDFGKTAPLSWEIEYLHVSVLNGLPFMLMTRSSCKAPGCDSWVREDKIDPTLLPVARVAWHLKHAAKYFRPTDIDTCNLQQLHTGFTQLQMHYAFQFLRSPHAKNIPNWQLKGVAALNPGFSSVQGVASWVAAPTASQRRSG